VTAPQTRPAFARDFPRDAELDALVGAFEAGNFARVRVEAPALAKKTEDPEVRRAAEALRARVDPDPLVRWVLVLTLALLVALSVFWITHDGPGAAPHP
jgi:hypothetical protein